ncbi:hypothetical protein N7E81_08005 [Reichenbachiella carrageenanivorans]|uniref:Uncharacterized protein n=1 Tax=Reichenbachiella carrageenanivorans TaxID=2979869 RepID=A0ABY6D4H3_9BACT|nr:hypothetical protein [Reichenbachiella carrageenanivorans]UXX81041.1 hypothetical protein N7E81_08005 [Reichenbachiella carrageenanivorans]
MKLVIKSLSFLGLAFTAIPSFFVLAGSLSIEMYKTLMLVGTGMWLLTAPFWIFNKKENA